jgi:hypothetical protein
MRIRTQALPKQDPSTSNSKENGQISNCNLHIGKTRASSILKIFHTQKKSFISPYIPNLSGSALSDFPFASFFLTPLPQLFPPSPPPDRWREKEGNKTRNRTKTCTGRWGGGGEFTVGLVSCLVRDVRGEEGGWKISPF